ncbi:MAG TPA: hypothetical protein VG097_07940, partial [Gemmata sp.]|nr:hypothetical protein [Gemmata sp.]
MSLLRTSRWITGIPVLCALLFCATLNRAAYSKEDAKWDSKRTTPPDDLDEIKALQERVKNVVDKGTPCTIAILIGFETGSGVIVSEDGLVLTTSDVLTGPNQKGIDPLG